MFQVGTSNFLFVKTARFRESRKKPPSTTHGGRCQSTCLTQQVRPPHFVMFFLTRNFLVSFFGKQDITSKHNDVCWRIFNWICFFVKNNSWKFSNRMMKIHWTSWCKRRRLKWWNLAGRWVFASCARSTSSSVMVGQKFPVSARSAWASWLHRD